MKCLETQYFLNQLEKLSVKYRLVKDDYEAFVQQFSVKIYTPLGKDTYKCRWKNSSIPTGKRGGLRFIVQAYDDTIIPLLVYAKSIKSTVSAQEIIDAMKAAYKELHKQ